jgi:hypothetical protein
VEPNAKLKLLPFLVLQELKLAGAPDFWRKETYYKYIRYTTTSNYLLWESVKLGNFPPFFYSSRASQPIEQF